VVMAGMNLEARGLYIPRPLTPGRSPLIHPRRFLSLQRCHESFAISGEPPWRTSPPVAFFTEIARSSVRSGTFSSAP
jgi:hypothetical protein